MFAFLNKLEPGQLAYIDYHNKRYEYQVVSKRIVTPADVSVTAATNGYNLSLMTCYPTGTALKRLVVFFDLKQVDE